MPKDSVILALVDRSVIGFGAKEHENEHMQGRSQGGGPVVPVTPPL